MNSDKRVMPSSEQWRLLQSYPELKKYVGKTLKDIRFHDNGVTRTVCMVFTDGEVLGVIGVEKNFEMGMGREY